MSVNAISGNNWRSTVDTINRFSENRKYYKSPTTETTTDNTATAGFNIFTADLKNYPESKQYLFGEGFNSIGRNSTNLIGARFQGAESGFMAIG